VYELRLRRLFLTFCVVLSLITARAFALQVLEVGPPGGKGGKSDSWKSRAGRPQPFTVHPRRGEIFFADGTPMAWNVPGYGLEIEWGAVDDRIVPTVDEFRASLEWRAKYAEERDAAVVAEQRSERARTALAEAQATRRASLAAWRAQRLEDLVRLRPKQILKKDKPIATRWRCTICGTQRKSRGLPKKGCRECKALPSYESLPPLGVRDLAVLIGNAAEPIELTVARIQEALVIAMRRRERHPDWKSHAFLVKIPSIAAETISLHPNEFGGLVPVARSSRRVDPDARQIAGGTRFPSEDDVTRLKDEGRAARGLHVFSVASVLPLLIGNSNLEEVFDERLRGTPGLGQHVRKRENGFARETETVHEVVDGTDLRTTIRPELQRLAMDIAGASPAGGAGSAIVLDARDGAVLAIASASRDGMNHARSNIAPGSVYKLVTAVAALESGVSPEDSVECLKKGRIAGGGRYTCMHTHHEIEFHAAFVESCNAYFAQQAIIAGADAMRASADRLGLNSRPLVRSLGTKGVLSKERERRRSEKELERKLYPADLAFIGIGQGYSSASTLQVATAYARVASGGRMVTPYLLQRDRPDVASIPVDPVLARWSPLINDAARGVVVGALGSARKVRRLQDVDAAGKTGTAEVSIGQNGAESVLNNTLFVGYAPYDDPRYVAIVVYERMPNRRYGGEATGPAVAELLAEALRE